MLDARDIVVGAGVAAQLTTVIDQEVTEAVQVEIAEELQLDRHGVRDAAGLAARAMMPAMILIRPCDGDECESITAEMAEQMQEQIRALHEYAHDEHDSMNRRYRDIVEASGEDGELALFCKKHYACYAGIRSLKRRLDEVRTYAGVIAHINETLRNAQLNDFLDIVNNVHRLPMALARPIALEFPEQRGIFG